MRRTTTFRSTTGRIYDGGPVRLYYNTGLFKMIVGNLTTCHTQYTWDGNIWLHRWIKKFSVFFLLWAPPHFHRHVREFLNQHLPQPWIGSGTDDDQMLLAWPPRSPDATPCDFLLWGYVKGQVYVPPLPASTYPGTEGTNQNRHWNRHSWHATDSLEWTRLSCWCL